MREGIPRRAAHRLNSSPPPASKPPPPSRPR
jgi:hypothetical protein